MIGALQHAGRSGQYAVSVSASQVCRRSRRAQATEILGTDRNDGAPGFPPARSECMYLVIGLRKPVVSARPTQQAGRNNQHLRFCPTTVHGKRPVEIDPLRFLLDPRQTLDLAS